MISGIDISGIPNIFRNMFVSEIFMIIILNIIYYIDHIILYFNFLLLLSCFRLFKF